MAFSVTVCRADDGLFESCHDFDYADDIYYSIPAGFSVFDYESAGYNSIMYINIDNEYPLKYAGWIYPVMALSEAKDCLLLYPSVGFNRMDLKEYPKEELRSLAGNKDLDTSDMIEVVCRDDMSSYANADTAYVYEFDFKKPYMDRFTHCIGICLRKYAHPGLMLKIALTDEGLARRDEYVKAMLGSVRYGTNIPEEGIRREKLVEESKSDGK